MTRAYTRLLQGLKKAIFPLSAKKAKEAKYLIFEANNFDFQWIVF